jgi:hypothetical protein
MGRLRQRSTRSIATVALIGGFIGAGATTFTGAGPASAQSTGISILQPSSGATLSGTLWFDAAPNASGDTGVQFVLSNPQFSAAPCAIMSPSSCLVGNAALSWVGWVVQWNTDNVPNGTYTLTATVSPSGATSSIPVTVSNPPPTVVYPADGSTVSSSQWLDCVAPPTAWLVAFVIKIGGATAYLGNASLSWVGWVFSWYTAALSNGTYSVACGARYPEGGIPGVGPFISVTVSH